MSPLNIVQVCPYDLDRPGGVQVHVLDTAAALADLGHQVTIIGPKVRPEGRNPAPSHPRIRHIRLGRAHSVRFSGTKFEVSLATGYQHRRLAAIMREGGFDVAHYHSLWTPALPFQAFACSRAASVVTFHDTPPDTVAGRISRGILGLASRLLLPHIDGAIAVSEAPRRHLSPASGQRIWVEPPCTDLRRFSSVPPERPAPDSPFVTILFVGRLEPRKGVMILLESYRRLCSEGLPVRLVIAGGGGEEAALKRYVAVHGLPRVTFLGRFDDADAPGLFAGCDIACAPSPYGESFGIVVAEAMASGRPVVAASNPGYRTLLTGEAAELLATPGDAGALYDRLKRVVLDPRLRARLGAWGREQSARYDSRTVAPRLLEIYRHAIARHARGASSASAPDTLEPHAAIERPSFIEG